MESCRAAAYSASAVARLAYVSNSIAVIASWAGRIITDYFVEKRHSWLEITRVTNTLSID